MIASTLLNSDSFSLRSVIIFDMFQVFFAVIIGAFSIGNAVPNLQNLAVARGAAYVVFQLIEQVYNCTDVISIIMVIYSYIN